MANRILVVDDEENMRFFLTEAMSKRGFEVEGVGDAENGLARLQEKEFDIVIMDVRLPGMSGIEAIPKVRQADPGATVIMMTAYSSRPQALEAVRAGAYDFFTKPFKIEEMVIVVQRALEKRTLQREVCHLEERLQKKYAFENIIGDSGPMQEVFGLVRRVVGSDVTCLIYGESGTGKELIAQAIHCHSRRTDEPFVKLNCVAIPEGLLESELFGHEKGAFTGAQAAKPGKFEMANRGTIFLDEIGDMSLATQAKILRVLQEKEFERVGGTETVKIDVRVIAATNKDLAKAVELKQFREDLFYRLNVFSIHLPPLRQRKEDIALLVDYFLQRVQRKTAHPLRRTEDMPMVAANLLEEGSGHIIQGITKEAMDVLMQYDWPGNVRELENCIQRAVVMAEGDLIGVNNLPLHLQSLAHRPKFTMPKDTSSLDASLADIEKEIIVQALSRTRGVQSKAAKDLGITERSLWHRVKKYSIDVARIREK